MGCLTYIILTNNSSFSSKCMTAEFIAKPRNLRLYSCLNWSVCVTLERLPTAHQLESPDPGFLPLITGVISTETAKVFSSFPWVPKAILVVPGDVPFFSVKITHEVFGFYLPLSILVFFMISQGKKICAIQ